VKVVKKGWGEELWIVNLKYCGKILTLKKGKKCSIHFHNEKDETFYVLSGKINLELFNKYAILKKSIVLNKDDIYRIKPGVIHRFTGIEDSKIFEVSTTHKESDTYRLVKGD